MPLKNQHSRSNKIRLFLNVSPLVVNIRKLAKNNGFGVCVGRFKVECYDN